MSSGAGVCRWLGASHAVSRWVAFCDADDLWSADKLKVQLDAMLEHGLHFSFLSFAHFRLNARLEWEPSRVLHQKGPYTLGAFLRKKFIVPCFTVVVSRWVNRFCNQIHCVGAMII